MRPHRSRIEIALFLALLVAAGVLPGAVPAQEAVADEEEIDLEALEADRAGKQSRYPLERRVSRYLASASKKLDEDGPEEAERLLLKLNMDRLNPLQRAYVYRLLAVIAYGNEEPDKAIGYFKKVLDQEALPIADENKVRFTVAQLNAQLERWPEVISWLTVWRRYERSPDPLGIYLMGLAHFQMDQHDVAIAKVIEAIGMSNEPRESWLKMLYALHTEKQDYEKATPVLEELLVRFPKKQYWTQLSLIYGARDDYPRSLAVQQVAYAQGFLTEDKELLLLARTYLYNELPYPAAAVIEKGLESGQIEEDADAYELLANSWIAAREFERSLPPLEKAAELSEGGKLYVRLGQVLLQREQWDDATQMFERALEKGELEKPGNVQLLLGIAHFNADRFGRARRHFVNARRYSATRAEADRWITHLANDPRSQAG